MSGKEPRYQPTGSDFVEEKKPFHRIKIIIIYVFIFLLLLPGFLIVTGKTADIMLGDPSLISNSWQFPACILIGSGLVLTLGAMLQLFLQGRGLPISHLPPKAMVAKGLYRLMRHPIYSGFILLMIGLALQIKSAGVLSISIPILIMGTKCYISFYEEPALLRRYGNSYQSYINKVPALVPMTATLRSKLKNLKEHLFRYFTQLANHTILFRYGNAIFVTYGLLTSVGAILFMQHSTITLISQGFTITETAVFLATCGISGIAGARLYWWIAHLQELKHQPFWGFRSVGFVSWGAPIGFGLAVVIFSYHSGHHLLVLTDILFSGMFIGYGFGRLGCLTYGCCFGKTTEKPGIIYHTHQAKANRMTGKAGVPRYPTQLYSAAHGLLLFIILNVVLLTEPMSGVISVLALIYYGIGRFYEEFHRDRPRIGHTFFTEGHLGSLIFITIGFGLMPFVSVISSGSLQAWSWKSVILSLQLMPLIIVLGIILFFVMAYHHKEIGRW